MKKVNYIFLSMFVVFLATECKDPKEPEPITFNITATIDGNLGIVWETGDEIKLVCADEVYTFVVSSGGASAQLTSQIEGASALATGNTPVSAYANCATLDGAFNIPSEQSVKDGVSTTRIPMFAYTTGNSGAGSLSLNFKPLASVLELEIDPYSLVAEKLIIAPAANAVVSGGAVSGGFKVNAETSAVSVTNSTSSITAVFTNALNLGQGATVRIPIGWFAIEGGLEIVFYQGAKTFTITLWEEDGMVRTFTEGTGGVRQARLIRQTESITVNVTATIESALGITWEPGDEIKLVCGGKVYTFATTEGGSPAQFISDSDDLSALTSGNPVYAYANCTSIDGDFSIPSEQSPNDDYSIPMYSCIMNPDANNLSFTFRPLVSILELEIEPTELIADGISFAPAASAVMSGGAIAGEFTINAVTGAVTASDPVNSVAINFNGGLNLAQGATVKIPIGWFAIEGGLDVTFHQGTETTIMKLWEGSGVVKTYTDAAGLMQARLIYQYLSSVIQKTYYVKANGSPTASGLTWNYATTLSTALTNAVPGSTIHVAAGTYYPENTLQGRGPIEQTKTFEIFKNITIIGGYPANATDGAVANPATNKTILDGNDASYHTMVVSAPKEGTEKVSVTGITIRGGKSTSANSTNTSINDINLADNYGAGVALVGTRVELINCTISENNGHHAAGLWSSNSDVTITGCSISDNVATGTNAGAWFTVGSNLVMQTTVIDGNTSTSTAAGLYLQTPAAGNRLSATLTGCTISNNVTSGNMGGLFISDNSGNQLLESSFTNCTISGNRGGAGAAIGTKSVRTSFTGCTIKNNMGTGNGMIIINTDPGNHFDSHITFDRCNIADNEVTYATGSAIASGIYAHNNAATTKIDVIVLNSTLSGNACGGRGAALYARNNSANDNYVNVTCVNTTFSGNKSRQVAGAIAVYSDAATRYTNVTLISCTVTGNRAATGGGIYVEMPGSTLKTYNTIVSGNMNLNDNGANELASAANVTAGSVVHSHAIIGNLFYDAGNTSTATSPLFDASTMFGTLANNGGSTWTHKLIGNAASNPAFGTGMTAAQLGALSSTAVSTTVLGQDQTGAARTDTDKIIGACVVK